LLPVAGNARAWRLGYHSSGLPVAAILAVLVFQETRVMSVKNCAMKFLLKIARESQRKAAVRG